MSGAAPSADEPDVFEQLFALLTPARLLRDPRANGAGVRVGLIDTGVDTALLHERARGRGQALPVIESVRFEPGQDRPVPCGDQRSAPHGTTVADILLTLAPAIQLYSADVFGPRGSVEVEVVQRALRWAVQEQGCHVVNLSLGVPENRLQQVPRRYQFLRAIEEAYHQGVIVVAAAHNDHPLTYSYPAVFAPPLLSVDKRAFADPLQFAYAPRAQIEFQAHGRGYVGPFAGELATSWAAPHLAAIAARLLSLRPGLKPFEVKTLLYWLSRHAS